MRLPLNFFRFIVGPVAEGSRGADRLEQLPDLVPGVRVGPPDSAGQRIVGAHENAAFLVVEHLQEVGLTYRVIEPKHVPVLPDSVLRLAAQERFDAPPLLNYQQAFLTKARGRTGVAAFHAPGAGKTRTTLTWALEVPGRIVVVTRAAARMTWIEEVRKYFTVPAMTLTDDFEKMWHAFLANPTGSSLVAVYKRGAQNPLQVKTLASCFTPGQPPPTLEVITKIEPPGQLAVGWLTPLRVRDGRRVRYDCGGLGAVRLVELPRIVIVGWESLQAWLPLLLKLNPTTVIFDESQYAASSRRWRAVTRRAAEAGSDENGPTRVSFEKLDNRTSAAADLARACARRCIASATPAPDRVSGLWSQLDLIEPGAWGSPLRWKKRYAGAIPGAYGGWQATGATNVLELRRRLYWSAHVVPHSVTHANLPPTRNLTTYIPVDAQAKAPEYAEELAALREGGDAKTNVELRLAEACARKRPALMALAREALDGGPMKVVVFTARRRDCEVLAAALRKACPNVAQWSAHGEQSTDERDAIRADYMAHPGPCCLIATGHAFGVSVNLQDTDLALYAMLPYRPGDLDQWRGRFTRRGQKRPVLNHYLIAEGTIDERVAEILIAKLPAVEAVTPTGALDGIADSLAGGDDLEAIARNLLESTLSVENTLDV